MQNSPATERINYSNNTFNVHLHDIHLWTAHRAYEIEAAPILARWIGDQFGNNIMAVIAYKVTPSSWALKTQWEKTETLPSPPVRDNQWITSVTTDWEQRRPRQRIRVFPGPGNGLRKTYNATSVTTDWQQPMLLWNKLITPVHPTPPSPPLLLNYSGLRNT